MSLFDEPDALAAFGVLRNLRGRSLDPAEIDSDLIQRVVREVAQGTVRLELGSDPRELPDVTDATLDLLADSWRRGAAGSASAGRQPGLRIQIDGIDVAAAAPVWRRINAARGVSSVAIVDRSVAGPRRWSWPLRVTPLGSGVADAVHGYGNRDLLRVIEDSRRGTDLLIAEHPDVLEQLTRADPGAGLLLLFMDSLDAFEAFKAAQIGAAVPYRALAAVRRPDHLDQFLWRFFDELAHDQPPDIALSHAAPGSGDFVVLGDTGFLDRARVSLANADLERAIEQALKARKIDLTEFGTAMDAVRKVSSWGPGPWGAEGGAATASVHETGPTRELLESRLGAAKGTRTATETRAGEAARFLQAQVDAEGAGAWTRRTHSFEPGAKHRLNVRVGPSDLDWVRVEESFPDKDLPEDGARLTVTLRAPAVLAEPARQEIHLRPTGASTVARFELEVPEELEELTATVLVHHKGKLLQAATLEGAVAAGDRADETIRLRLGAPSLVDLGHQREFQLSIWKNRDELEITTHDPDAPIDAPSHTPLKRSLPGIKEKLDDIRDQLFVTASKLDQLEGTIDDQGLELIRNFAVEGWDLRWRLFGDEPPDHIRRIQFTSPYSSDSFPVEFLYDYDQPGEQAELCPGFKQTAGIGCKDCSARRDGEDYVCPSGFWGLNRSIERQVRPMIASCNQPESSDLHPGPLAMKGMVFAAAEEVNEDDPERIKKTIEALGEIAPVSVASTWNSWKKLVREQYPALLIALPHNVEGSPQKLRIAADQDLAFSRIRPEHVVPEKASIGSPVLLFACNSANAKVTYQDFVTQLRCAGAPLVVATITYVLGPQAAPVARELASQLWANKGVTTVGEILMRVRDRMLKQDNLMALTLVAYGDADWRI